MLDATQSILSKVITAIKNFFEQLMAMFQK